MVVIYFIKETLKQCGRILGNENLDGSLSHYFDSIFICKIFYHNSRKGSPSLPVVDEQSLRRQRPRRQQAGPGWHPSWLLATGLRRRLCVECPEFPTPVPWLSVPMIAFLGHSHQHRNLRPAPQKGRASGRCSDGEGEAECRGPCGPGLPSR